MGFGKKTDFETNRVLDLDKSYRYMIKPAVEAAGLKCIRADEIVHSGLIDVPMYEQLLKADVVIADLSTSNKNAFYELGVRHALRPFTTIIIAEDGIKAFPFDINHITIRKYHHLGEDIGFEEVMRFREQLTDAIVKIMQVTPRAMDSPVYTYLTGLTPPEIAAAVQSIVQESVDKSSEEQNRGSNKINTELADTALKSETHSALMAKADEAQKKGDWDTAKTVLSLIYQMMKDEIPKKTDLNPFIIQEDPYILQRLALATYKSKIPDEKTALLDAQKLLNTLNPETSNDSETLGLWGAIHKRLWEITKDKIFLDKAVHSYERGFYIMNDHYNGINYAFLLNVRASQSTVPAQAIADYITARNARREVLIICEQWLKNNPLPDAGKVPESILTGCLKNWYWVKATMGEAYLGLEDEEKAKIVLEDAYKSAPEGWMKTSTEEQLEKLRPLLDDSPLKFIRSDV
ncbi:DUF4071 domain-containing protein [Mucilaginibacter rubeus]|uniref:DUF4071 domain-containing protein n=2 Tax=Mucilaginibacter rubeus TaxID=2027860 RepID=A0A5C1I7T4_9SPHI|nr:DUF4071 domain-containing protein [Mucilaginibacter rubeus]